MTDYSEFTCTSLYSILITQDYLDQNTYPLVIKMGPITSTTVLEAELKVSTNLISKQAY